MNNKECSEANRLKFLATTLIEKEMARQGISRSGLAHICRLNLPTISAILDGEMDMTFETLALFSVALDIQIRFTIQWKLTYLKTKDANTFTPVVGSAHGDLLSTMETWSVPVEETILNRGNQWRKAINETCRVNAAAERRLRNAAYKNWRPLHLKSTDPGFWCPSWTRTPWKAEPSARYIR